MNTSDWSKNKLFYISKIYKFNDACLRKTILRKVQLRNRQDVTGAKSKNFGIENKQI